MTDYPYLHLVSYIDPAGTIGAARIPMAHPIATEQHLDDLTAFISTRFAGGRQVAVTGYQLVCDPLAEALHQLADDIAATSDTPVATLLHVQQRLRQLAGHFHTS